jgi:uncharacterized membrane-anchored protein YhcB (DUF1043 family)
MNQFIETNWLSLVSILIGIVVAYVFYRLQKKDTTSAANERKKHATNELLDVVESYIINKQALSEDVIENLVQASERDHAVQLRPLCTATSLLQDVALRLQRSRHLDIPQKSEYSLKIEELIRDIRSQVEPRPLERLTTDIQQAITQLEAVIPDEKREEVRKQLSQLAALTEKKREIVLRRADASDYDLIGPVVAGLAGLTASLFLGSKALSNMASSPLSPLFEKLFPILGGVVGMAILLQVLVLVLRIRKRSQQGRKDGRSDEG